MRKETISLAFGRDGFGAGISAGFVVAALNIASAACRGSVDLRGLSTLIFITSFRVHSASWNGHAFMVFGNHTKSDVPICAFYGADIG
jgi:hypothetical protein